MLFLRGRISQLLLECEKVLGGTFFKLLIILELL
jgi:hypothetical protein